MLIAIPILWLFCDITSLKPLFTLSFILMINQITASLDTPLSPKAVPAAVLLAVTNEATPRLLLCRRASQLKSHAGEVSLPGGKRELADSTNASVALRETHEETGIHPSDVQIIGELPTRKSLSGLLVKPIVGIIPPDVQLVPEASEVARLFWVDVADLTQANITPYQITYKGLKVHTPSYQVEGEVIWGLTGRILISFVNKAFNKKIKWPMLMMK